MDYARANTDWFSRCLYGIGAYWTSRTRPRRGKPLSFQAAVAAFDWADITGVGTPLTLTDDDSNGGPVAIGVDFPFYGNIYGNVRVCTNGLFAGFRYYYCS